ncbi:MAG TPA: hypothetical protein VM286_08760 [Candidatus Thermoplasmatota archaeon]|nr:hypothetical protein [Candidatus Thermoplasmatota archaeon]
MIAVDDVAAISPPMAGTLLWLATEDNVPRRHEVAQFFAKALEDKFGRRYAERYFELVPDKPFSFKPATVGGKHALNDCLLSIEAYLRRFALADLGIPRTTPSLAFKEHPKFQAALALLPAYADYAVALSHMPITTCSQCGLVGQVDNWFGWNRGLDPPQPQSRCRICQAPGALKAARDD